MFAVHGYVTYNTMQTVSCMLQIAAHADVLYAFIRVGLIACGVFKLLKPVLSEYVVCFIFVGLETPNE
jgi:hypothetical protein